MNHDFYSKRVVEFIRKINFIRFAATENEKHAAEIIKSGLDAIGLETALHHFPIATSHASQAEFKFLEPYKKSVNITHREHIAPAAFEIFGEFAIQLTSRIINAPALPFKRCVGKNMAKKIKEYFDSRSPEEPEITDE